MITIYSAQTTHYRIKYSVCLQLHSHTTTHIIRYTMEYSAYFSF